MNTLFKLTILIVSFSITSLNAFSSGVAETTSRATTRTTGIVAPHHGGGRVGADENRRYLNRKYDNQESRTNVLESETGLTR